LPSAGPGGPPHQALCRRSHLVTMSELIRLAAQVELFTLTRTIRSTLALLGASFCRITAVKQPSANRAILM
jgi:hypothetical protein